MQEEQMYTNLEQSAKRAILIATVLAAAVATPAAAGDWANWRGPHHNGSTDETNLPTEWSGTENIRWSAALPGPSSSTPIISGDRVFVASNDKTLKKLFALCFDRKTGERLWGKQLAETDWLPGRNTMCAPSPVTDGKLVYFFYGTSDLFALDFDGNEVWSKNLDREVGPTSQQFAYGGSPLLYKGKLYFPVLRGQWRSSLGMNSYTDKDSFLVGLDAASGDLLWKVHRPSDAIGESFDSYASAVPYAYGGAEYIIVQGGDYLTGHSAETGEELWRQSHSPRKGRNSRLIPTPVVAGELVIGVQARGLDAFAVRPERNAAFEYSDSHWIYRERTTDVPSPIYYQGRLYFVNGVRRTMMCVDPATGEEIWNESLGLRSRIWASPTASDGKIYCFSESGETTVVSAGDTFEIVARNAALPGDGPAKSSIAIAQGNLFIRTGSTLYCVGE